MGYWRFLNFIFGWDYALVKRWGWNPYRVRWFNGNAFIWLGHRYYELLPDGTFAANDEFLKEWRPLTASMPDPAPMNPERAS